MKSRQYNTLDRCIMFVDNALSDIYQRKPQRKKRPYPAAACARDDLCEHEKRHLSGLMRVNHAGEIAAQALYKAQTLTAKDDALKEKLQQSADEEIDHLDWCEARLQELDDHTSYLVPVWYMGAFSMGIIAGCCGDKWNLAFLAETEHQVVRHLDGHLKQLAEHDHRSRAILEQMREDELHHATTAEAVGANKLPKQVERLMAITAKIMTKTAYRI